MLTTVSEEYTASIFRIEEPFCLFYSNNGNSIFL
jgi:hypothetical protein